MADFATFHQSFDADPSKRGKQFEHFVKWFLKTDPEWSTQVGQVWLWGEYPERWGVDCGIDLVFRHKNGQHWAVQAKCYSRQHRISKQDVDKFLSESNRPSIQHRLLIGTTDLMGSNARQVCEGQEKPVTRFLFSDFESSKVDYPANFAKLSQAKRKPPPKPRPYQKEAITSVVQGLRSAERGQLIMACGTGKTYVTQWIREDLDAQRTLVMVPSLGLLSQVLREWTYAATTPFDVLCVCSDKTVAKDYDEAIHSVADLSFEVTSSVDKVKDFLSGPGQRVVFSTYQSSSVIAAAQAYPATPAFDLTVADEAHRCAGKVGSEFSTVLDNTQIRSAKRLFATATPRTYASTVKKAAEERGVEVVGMDDPALFGEVLYSLPFGEAIERKLLTDYRVVIIGVDDPTIAGWIADRELVATGTGIETDSESLAAQIGLLKAIKEYDLRRIISFHSRVNRAEVFTNDIHKIVDWISDEHRPGGTLCPDYVSGNMPASARNIKLGKLKAIGADERGILSNARCLSEGVDVPSLDGVAFVDPRRSQIDIIQAVGRAIRLSPDPDKIGTIVLPVFIAAGQNAADTIEASHFKPIWDVLNALKAHDDVLACELDQLRMGLGKKPGSSISEDSLGKITIDLPVTVGTAFADALRTHLVEQVTQSWYFWFGLLQAYVEREEHAKVPPRWKTLEGYGLGAWVGKQRAKRDSMALERKDLLRALQGWSWDAHDAKWEEAFRCLKEFADRHRHSRVPSDCKTADGHRLRLWIVTQRINRDSLAPERQARLEAVPGWSWDARADNWEEGFRHLQEFVGREGHGDVPARYQTANGYPLGNWIGSLRSRRDSLTLERKARLEAVPGWSWDPNSDKWEEGFRCLQEFVGRERHANVLLRYRTADGYPLGNWIGTQRTTRDGLTLERKARLEALPGWSWGIHYDQWEEGFRRLQEFVGRERHAKVIGSYQTADGYGLGGWVVTQRSKKDSLTLERKAQLEALPGWRWHVHDDKWEEGFRHLQEFEVQNGHINVPKTYKTADGYSLGNWMGLKRSRSENLTPERKAQLEALSGWRWHVHDDKWEEGFRHLQEFIGRERHADVPTGHQAADGYPLGTWAGTQRSRRDGLTLERKAQLEALPGWSWDVHESRWEEGFRRLKEFVGREQHANILGSYQTADGYRLGSWVVAQRVNRDGLTQERKGRLEAVPGWSWHLNNDKWEKGFRCLKEFIGREQHAMVPQSFRTDDGYRLGKWLSAQRTTRDTMSPERKSRLEDLPGWSW